MNELRGTPIVRDEWGIRDVDGRIHHVTETPYWNETISLGEAAERWWPGAEVVHRTITTWEPVVSGWFSVAKDRL